MSILDWVILAVPLLIVLSIGLYTQRYLKSVADFMAGGRLAGRYLLCVARGEIVAGAVVFIAMFELFAKAGLTYTWWQMMQIFVMIIVSATGFVVYRYRETRALTLAQFFELRYTKKYRLFTGLLGFGSGILNFGVIPAIEAHFFVHFLGMPVTLPIMGFDVPTFILVMMVLMAGILWLTLSGGQITVMITDCTEGLLSYFIYVLVTFSLLAVVDWDQVASALGQNKEPGYSMLNPFDGFNIQDFNLVYVMISIVWGVYGTMAWQNASGYNAAALTPHESRMGNVLGRWRDYIRTSTIAIWGIIGYAFLVHPDFAATSVAVQESLDRVADPAVQNQMRVPTALSLMLPAGFKGLLCAMFAMGVFGGQTTHLHSWGGILVQDIIVPLRKKPFTPRQHMWALRLAIVGVAIFAMLFGSLFQQTEYIMMWWQVTMAIFVSGAGSAIIGGLYWKKATPAAAWTATILGAVLAGGGIIMRQIYGEAFPLNGNLITFWSMVTSILVFIIVSLLTCREDFNLDRMLHRGEYFVPTPDQPHPPRPQTSFHWYRIAGIDESFPFWDKVAAGGIFGWSMVLLSTFIVGCVWNFYDPWSFDQWSTFWFVLAVVCPVVLSVFTTIWFTIGCLKDMRLFFARLRNQTVDHLDDGTVVGHRNLSEATSQTNLADVKTR